MIRDRPLEDRKTATDDNTLFVPFKTCDTASKWFALYTKSRHEKFVEAQLLKRGINAYTPKITLRKKWSDRTKLIEEPLFKSYCFAKLSLQDRAKVTSHKGVVSIVHFNGEYINIEESVINSLKIMIEHKLKLDPCPYLKEGDKVSIRKGHLRGLEGYIVEKRNKNMTLVVSIDAIASSVRCILDIDYVDTV